MPAGTSLLCPPGDAMPARESLGAEAYMHHRRRGKKCRAEQAAFVASKGLVEEFERVSRRPTA